MLLLQLFWSFFTIGALTFGGGYAMLSMLQEEIVNKRGWVTDDEMLDYFAIGQCTPGIIAVNTATFVGYKLRGVVGGIVATLGMIVPGMLVITIIALALQNFMELEYVRYAFAGIRVAVSAMIVNTIIGLVKKHVRNPMQIALCVLAFALVAFVKLSPVYIVPIVIVVGLAQTKWPVLKGGSKA